MSLASGLAYLVGAAAVLVAGFAVSGLAARAALRRRDQAVRRGETALFDSLERLRRLAGQLIVAQDTTRAELARDLHDDVCQKLLGVAMGLGSLRRAGRYARDVAAQDEMSHLERATLDIVEDVRNRARALHPASLELVGVAAAIAACCRELEDHHDVQVCFTPEGEIAMLPRETARSLFRIAQEAIRNAAVHGNPRRIAVTLARRGGDVELTISDDGRGFDPAAVRRTSAGLGLATIEERARLAAGSVRIDSAVGMGARIRVLVPAVRSGPSAADPGSAAAAPLFSGVLS